MLCDGLVAPLRTIGTASDYGFDAPLITGSDATRARLQELYSAKTDRPAIYFCGTHGLKRGSKAPALPETMGALLCEDWHGDTPPVASQWFAGADIPAEADLSGTMHFLFACYGGGWPAASDYDKVTLAGAPMVARLPQNILAKGALAVFAHIDRVWSYSYQAGDGTDRSQEFDSILSKLMDTGARAGHATDAFNTRWNIFAGLIKDQIRDGVIPNTQAAHDLWIQHDDARNYVLYGDPAVRLRVESMPVVK
jgi:hypothetical protein